VWETVLRFAPGGFPHAETQTIKQGLKSPFLSTRLVHFYAAIWHNFAPPLTVVDTVFVLTGGGPGISTETLTLYTYQEGFKKFNLGYTSAISFLFLIIVTLFSLLYVAVVKPQVEKRS
jgi:ABC-type sugar transport system permease subunit